MKRYMPETWLGPIATEHMTKHFPQASLIGPGNLKMSPAIILGSGRPVIVGTGRIYGPEHTGRCELELDYIRTLETLNEKE